MQAAFVVLCFPLGQDPARYGRQTMMAVRRQGVIASEARSAHKFGGNDLLAVPRPLVSALGTHEAELAVCPAECAGQCLPSGLRGRDVGLAQ